MKSNRGISYKLLIIIVVILMVLGFVIYNKISNKLKNEEKESIKTDLLLVQGEVKQKYINSKIDKDNTTFIGKKITELAEEDISNILGKIDISESDRDKYYLLSKENIKELGIGETTIGDNEIIVNYETSEIIYLPGYVMEDSNVYYKLSEMIN